MNLLYVLLFLIALLLITLAIYSRLKRSGKPSVSTGEEAAEVLEISISRNDADTKEVQTSALSAENMFAALHGLLRESAADQERFSFEVVFSGTNGIRFYVTAPSSILKYVEGQIYAQYPDASISLVQDYTSGLNTEDISNCEVTTVEFSKPYFFPLKTFRDFETDPLSSFTSSLSHLNTGEEVWFQIVVKPIADVWQSAGFSYVKAVREGTYMASPPNLVQVISKTASKELITLLGNVATGLFVNKVPTVPGKPASSSGPALVRLSPIQELETQSIENKLSRVGYKAIIRIISASPSKERTKHNMRDIVASLKQYSTSSSNTLVSKIQSGSQGFLNAFVQRSFDDNSAILLNSEELATIYHLPSVFVDTPNISWAYSRKTEPPSNLPTKNCCFLGDTMFRSKKVRFGLANDNDRLRHMYVIGKSGVGKSTLFQTMLMQDIKDGAGVCLLDPHGETIEKVLDYIPDNRINDVIYIDPSDTEHPIGLNLLEIDDPSEKNIMVSGLLSAIKQHFDFSWGPRLEYLLNYALLTLVEVKGTTMLGITRLLDDKNYRNYILHHVEDPVIKRFWDKEFKEMSNNPRFITEAISPIQNKVGRFLASTIIRNLLGQAKSTVNIWDVMQNRKILLINLSKGKIGADNANLLGALLVSRIQFYALQRAKIADNERVPFYLYVDEFQNFASGSFEEILSESRKYKLGLYLTHQFTAQLPEPLLKAVLGNVGTVITFSAGAMDAQIMANEFSPFTAEDINTLEKFQVYIKLMIDGMTSLPFSARILTPWEDTEFLPPKTANKEKVILTSREKYGSDRAYVETKINKWVEMQFDRGIAISEDYRKGDRINKD